MERDRKKFHGLNARKMSLYILSPNVTVGGQYCHLGLDDHPLAPRHRLFDPLRIAWAKIRGIYDPLC